MTPFVPLHLHTTYSLLDGACKIKPLVARARALGMPALAITDHGVLFGLKAFYDECRQSKDKAGNALAHVKPILGCEAYVARRSRLLKDHNAGDLSGNHLILLAKNLAGYHNLVRLISLAHVEGFYGRPRIDHELLEKYREGLIVSSACIAGEVAEAIDDGHYDKARETALWYKDLFGDDYYLEVMLHKAEGAFLTPGERGTQRLYERQLRVNEAMFRLGAELGIKVVATNDTHFLMKEDAEAHDILLCLSSQSKETDPNRLRYTRQEWLKDGDEMAALFPNHPEALANTLEVAEKVEEYELDAKPTMPVFPIPESFGTDAAYEKKYPTPESIAPSFEKKSFERFEGNTPAGLKALRRILFESDYLRHLTYEGAAKRWPGDRLDAEHRERLDFELSTIQNMGFPGYFLIVGDYVRAAKEMGVLVGPGRGSAAGSAVAYCLGITDVDPLPYHLLFERFLNPDRISMPDIDEDFDDAGRGRVLDYVTNKYGADHVAHIVTFGSMAPKTCILDISRALDVPVPDARALSNLIPADPGIKSFADAYKASNDLRAIRDTPVGTPLQKRILRIAEKLEGGVRQPGVHACGVLISRDPLIDTIPIMPTDGESLMNTQYDGHYVEPIGLLKMDFLGLKTLTVFKECLATIKEVRGEDVDLSSIPLDDPETFKVFQRGDTTGLFQFESDGMKKNLRELCPERLEDLVAMNALYRPGPMAYIPLFIDRKQGRKPIVYEHPLMQEYLEETYGVTVYQEQVMLLSRSMGGFTRGESDTLRKAMGKKQLAMMEKLKAKFHDGCLANPRFMEPPPVNGDKEAAERLIDKIWNDWREFAKYAFNKSHAVCYAYVAYQTGYLKAHYAAEYMCAQISSEIGNFDKMPVFIAEAADMGYEVLGPDVNKSSVRFVPEGDRKIRYGLAGIKGVGIAAAETIVAGRRKDGPYKSLHDFLSRLDVAVNRKALESLVRVGALDSFGYHRAALLDVLPQALARAASEREDRARGQASLFELFGGGDGGADPAEAEEAAERDEANRRVPAMPRLEQLLGEKELLGMYLSGHPIARFQRLVERFTPLAGVDRAMQRLDEAIAAARGTLGEVPLMRVDEAAYPGGKSDPAYRAAKARYDKDSQAQRQFRRARSVPLRFCAFVSAFTPRLDKKGRNWCVLQLEDADAKREVPVFARDFERLTGDGPENQSLPPEERLPPRTPPQANRAYLFDAVVEPSYRFEAQLTVRDFMPLEEVPERFARKVVVTVPADRATPAFLKGVRELFERHPGRVRTGVQVRLADGLRVTLDSAADLRVNPDAAFLEDAEKVVGGRNLHFGVAAAQTPGGPLRFDRGAPAPAAEDADETVVPVDPVRGTAAEEDAPVQEELLLEDAQ